MRSLRSAGFTLVELMIVVSIIAVLAAVSVGAYRKYSDAGRTAEAMAMIGEIRTKENAYYAENNSYLDTNSTKDDSALTDLWPVVGGSCKEPCAKDIITSKPTPWTSLGLAPTRQQLYCGYLALAPGANNWGKASASAKTAVGGTNAPVVPWFYIHAVCDNNASKSTNTEYIATYNNSAVVTLNEHN